MSLPPEKAEKHRQNMRVRYWAKREEILRKQRAAYSVNPGRYKEKMAEYRKAHAEKARQANRQWHRDNPDRARETRREWAKKNPEKVRQSSAKSVKKHRAARTAETQRYRLKKLSQIHPDHSPAKELALQKERIRLDQETGSLHTVDHIIPVVAGGWHHHDNLQVLPKSVNSSKSANPFWERPGYKSWRDVPEHLWPVKLQPSYYALLLI